MHLSIPLGLLALLCVATSAVFLFVRAAGAAVRRCRATSPVPPIPSCRADELYAASFNSALLDIEQEAARAVRHVDPLAAFHRVRLEVAIQPDLAVRADPLGFRQVLNCLLENAIRHTPGGKVLVGGMRHGGRIQIAVLDDGQAPERREQQAVLRSVESIVALHGGTLQIETRPGQGTLVVLRLPEPPSTAMAHSQKRPAQTSAEPALSFTEGGEA